MVESSSSGEGNSKRKWLSIAAGLLGLGLIALIMGFLLWRVNTKDSSVDHQHLNPTEPGPPSPSRLGIYRHGAISCDAPHCAEIGKRIFKKNGTVADAAIATLLCMGVVHSQSMGLGGGFLLVLYNATERTSTVLNAREEAPSAAHENMFHGDKNKSQDGPLSVAIPGEMKGYYELYKRAGGGVPWKDLFEDTIKMCEDGFRVSNHTRKALVWAREYIRNERSMKDIYWNQKTNDVWKAGDLLRRPDLAKTLEAIAESPLEGDELYFGELASILVEDLAKMGGIITLEDMQNYQAKWEEPVRVDVFPGLKLHTVMPPGSGVLMAFIMNILSNYRPTPSDLGTENSTILVYHRIIESFKYAYAKRTELGDPSDPSVSEIVKQLVANLTSPVYGKAIYKLIQDNTTNNNYSHYGAEFYQPDDHGTAHLSIIGPSGDAISVTSTVNLYFGAKIRSVRTGIVFNDEMDDFSSPNITNYFGVPPSVNNFIKPGKRPLSSMSPAIFSDDDGKVRLVLGNAGGTKITTATALVSMRNLWFNEDIKKAIDAPRIHHQLYPMRVQYESGFLDQYVKGLEKLGHKTERVKVGSSVTCAISRDITTGSIFANSDFRKDGSISGF